MHHKQASILGSLAGIAGGFAASELGMKALQNVGRKSANDLVDLGITQGRNGQRMNPFTEKQFRNFLGNTQFEPYVAGQEIGKRMQNMPSERGERFLGKVQGMANSRKSRLAKEHEIDLQRHKALTPYQKPLKMEQTPLLDAVAKYDADRKGALHGILGKAPVPIDKATPMMDLVGNVASSPAGFLDHRIAARPLIHGAENTSVYQQTKQNLTERKPGVGKALDLVRNWYD